MDREIEDRLNERDKMRAKLDKPRGILNFRTTEAPFDVARYWPSDDLAPFVEHYWVVRWDLREPQVAETIPHPAIHMVLESSGTSEIVGVMRTKFSRVLTGRAGVVGTRFRPGAFRPFVDEPVAVFTDRRLPIGEVLGPRAEALGGRVARQDDDRRSIAAIESFLRDLRPSPDAGMASAVSVATHILEDRSITRVEQLAREFHTTVRGLQRLFKEYVGVSPKWVIQRSRLLEAVARLNAGTSVDWACLALDLGYADQAHFIRDFKRLIGHSPGDYARRLNGGDLRRPECASSRARTVQGRR